MRAIRFDAAVSRYALGLVLKNVYTPILWSGLSCTYAAEVPPPQLPAADWVRVKTRLGGICGTDLGAIYLPSYYNEPFQSSPFTLGHENVATIADLGAEVQGWNVGDRVVVEPLLWCRPRGFQELCRFCARGEVNRCERFTMGTISAGVLIGLCRDTGGSWSPYFVAHQSQLYRVPESVSDENGLMVEPFCIGLHAAIQNFPADEETVLIIGAGTIGLTTLAALRALGSQAEILVLARHPFQAEAARRLGASDVLGATPGEDPYQQLADRHGLQLIKPTLGKRVAIGGVDRTYECAGSDSAIDDALRLTRGGGTVILVGMPGITKRVDWTAAFIKELNVIAAFNYDHAEPYDGRTWKVFDLALMMMETGQVDLGWMVTHRYPLQEFGQALRDQGQRRGKPIIKAVFEFPE